MTTDKGNNNGVDGGERQAMYGRAKDLFLRLVEMPSDQRETLLAETCRDDPELGKKVRGLLECHDREPVEGQDYSPSSPVLPPSLGPFALVRLLGEGGTGAVYLAHGKSDQIPVALKVLHPGMLARESRLRFSRESEVLARLDHPGIAKLLDTGEESTPHGSVYYIATEFVDGIHLDQYLSTREFSLGEKLRLVLSVCEAVAHAHQAGVVHRDLKPANILVTEDGQPHVLDFGVSRILGSTGEKTRVTESGQLIGTLKFMSPEQAEGTEAGPQTDVYALGLILHEALTGQLPYEVPSSPIHQSLAAILTAEPTWPREYDPDLDPALDAIAARCLARDPDDRYPGASQLAADLSAFLTGQPVSAPSPRRSKKRSRSGSRWFVLAAILLVTVGWLSWHNRESESGSQERELRTILGMLDHADQELHFKQHTVEGLTHAVTILDSTKILLHQLPGSSTKTALLRYSSGRLGEAHYFLGTRFQDPAEFLLALRSFDSANHPLFDPAELASLPENAPVTSRAKRRGRHHPSLGQALALTSLAEHQRPRYNLEQAVFFCDEARKIQEEQRGPNYWPIFTESVRQEDRAIILNDLARNLTLLATVCDSLPLVEQALPLFAEADTSSALKSNLSAYASLLRGRARCFLTRAEMTRSPADLDSARFYLDRCLGLGESGSSASFRLNMLLTEAALLEVGWVGENQRDPDLTGRARSMARKTRGGLGHSRSPISPDLEAGLLQVEAFLAGFGAETSGDLHRLGLADSLLAEAQNILTAERFSFLRAELLLDQSEVAFTRFKITADGNYLQDVRKFLDQGLPFADSAFHPRLARLYAEAGLRYEAALANR